MNNQKLVNKRDNHALRYWPVLIVTLSKQWSFSVSWLLCGQMNGTSHPAVPGLKLGDLAESAAENSALSPVTGKHIGANGSDEMSTAAVLPPASRRTTENKVSACDPVFVWTLCLTCGWTGSVLPSLFTKASFQKSFSGCHTAAILSQCYVNNSY